MLEFRKALWGPVPEVRYMVGRKDELVKAGGQLLSDLVRYGGIESFVHYVPLVLAILKFVVRHPRRR